MERSDSIRSLHNAQVKYAHSLTVPKRLKESVDFLLEGFHLVAEALHDAGRVRYILATADVGRSPEGMRLHAEASRRKVKWLEASGRVLAYLSDTRSPQGIVAVAAKPAPRDPGPGDVLALSGVQDPGNLGTLLRSAEAAGAGGVLLSDGCCDPFLPKAVRASMGSVLRVPLQVYPNWGSALGWTKERGLEPVALDPKGSEDWRALEPGRFQAIWVGSEGSGLPDGLRAVCARRVRLPLAGRVESLNAGVAGSLALFYKAFRRSLP